MILYKRNAQGNPIYWGIDIVNKELIATYGLVGKNTHKYKINTKRNLGDELISSINAKRKEGYKSLTDLYDNAPAYIADTDNLWHYLNTYLPKFNTHEDGKFIPMLCKTLQDNKPFEKNSYIGDWKINGERCIITASKSNDLFEEIKLHYRSREGVDWTNKLSYMDDILVPILQNADKKELLEMMLEEGVGLDGELYLPGYSINEINSFIKNVDLPQHNQLQYWCYDIAVENMPAIARKHLLFDTFGSYISSIHEKEEHLNNKQRFVILPFQGVDNIEEATEARDLYIHLGFEGLVIRDENAEYQFGGRRNNAMLKFKAKEDCICEVVGISTDKRGLPVFMLKNDINDEVFNATYNATQEKQKAIVATFTPNLKAVVEFRERSGVKQVPFHAKIVKFV